MLFLRRYAVTLLLVAVVIVQQVQLRGLQRDLKNALVSPRLLEKGAEGKGIPVHVDIQSPSGGRPLPGRVSVGGPSSPFAGPSSVQPSQPPAPPRLHVELPPVYCPTKEVCDRIYTRAPQAISADAQIRTGTIVTVCMESAPGQPCPPEKRANLPLAEPIRFTANFVLAEKGSFTGLNLIGSPLEITRVRTETRIETVIPTLALPYYLGLEAGFIGTQGFAGVTYMNRAFGGIYRILAGYGIAPTGMGFTGGVFLTLPIR